LYTKRAATVFVISKLYQVVYRQKFSYDHKEIVGFLQGKKGFGGGKSINTLK
jgi:hypothetical protein